MKYIIMCGGTYHKWAVPRQQIRIRGEPLVARTIRLLKECGVEDIAISSNDDSFAMYGVPVLKHKNEYETRRNNITGYWCDAFYPTDEPTCYIFGDVLFSEMAIQMIVGIETDDIEFFASAPPFAREYIKQWAEPFALKVVDQEHLKRSIEQVKRLDRKGMFHRKPIMWELWSVIRETDINKIDYSSYIAINDYTCDIDDPDELPLFESCL